MEYYLAVDIGSSSSKVVLSYLTESKKLEVREVGKFVTPHFFLCGHEHIDVYHIYNEILHVIEALSLQKIEIASLGVDSYAVDFGVVNPHGELVGLPIFYRDKWTDKMINEVEKVISYEDLYSLTTQRKSSNSTLCQLLAVQKENQELLKNGNRILHIGDLLMYFFSGRLCSEFSVASYSQLFSMKNGCWEDKVFDLFKIPKSIQPPVVYSGTCLGKISESLAKKLGSGRFEIVAPPVHDTAAAGVAVPAVDGQSWGFIATGSWYLVGMELNAPANPKLSYKYNLSNTGLAFGKTMLKGNVCALWMLQECKRLWNRTGNRCDYSDIVAAAEQAEPFWGYINTDDSIFYNPDDMLDAVLTYLKQTKQRMVERENIGQIARILYESIMLKCRYCLETLERTTNQKVETIYVVGGASGVPFLNRLLASALRMPVNTGVKEAAAIGNSLIQAVALGNLSCQQEVREVVRNTFSSETFYPEEQSTWEKKYDEFLNVCRLKI